MSLLSSLTGARWFPQDWREANWSALDEVDLGSGQRILLAEPYPGGPRLQVPHNLAGEASADPQWWRAWLRAAGIPIELERVAPLGQEQSNTSVVLHLRDGQQWVAKLFRVVYPGQNPDVELPQALRAAGFEHTPAVRASLPWGESTLAVATDLVPNTGTAWEYFRAAAEADREVEAEAEQLGYRLGELHRALATLPVTGIAEVPAERVRQALARAPLEPELAGALAGRIDELAAAVKQVQLTRVHGDLHLGQILRTPDGDWQVIDFEGEPLRPLTERNRPDLAGRDLAGMLRSFSYAGWDHPEWARRTKEAFRRGFTPAVDEALVRLLEVEKALYEVEYEAQFRPDWLQVPLASINDLMQHVN